MLYTLFILPHQRLAPNPAFLITGGYLFISLIGLHKLCYYFRNAVCTDYAFLQCSAVGMPHLPLRVWAQDQAHP